MDLGKIGFYTLTDERAASTSPVSQMQRCEIIINEYCNFKCPYCRGLADDIFSDRKRKEMTIEEVCRTIDLWCEAGPLKNIRFSGGEPTYHRNLVQMVEYAKSKGIARIAVSTNGANKLALYQRLIDSGVNDFSISLDAADAAIGDMMAGNIPGAWEQVVATIQFVSQQVYTTCGVVLEPENLARFIDIVRFASSLGVTDIRVIPSAQWDQPLDELKEIEESILSKHKILRYRVGNFIKGRHVRGLRDGDTKKCPLVLDDSVNAGMKHYPCVIYMREQGTPIGVIGENMREERVNWFKKTDTHNDPICKKNCLDACIDHNNKVMRENSTVAALLE